MMLASGRSAGSGGAYRLDPFALPARSAGASPFTIERDRVVLVRPGRGGQPAVTVTLPIRSYTGVAVRMTATDAHGGIRVVVQLHHRDPQLILPLVVADEPEDVAADWQAWGRALNLPLLVIDQDGSVKAPLDHLGALVVGEAKPRRRHSFFAARRPRFLARRKPGRVSAIEVLTAREIIAPE
jgi:hypothetical protein